jgi:hypothetical protein
VSGRVTLNCDGRHQRFGLRSSILSAAAISIYLAVRANSAKSVPRTWVLGAMAVLFNPVLPIRMHRGDWRIVDALAAITFLVFFAVYKPRSYHPHT